MKDSLYISDKLKAHLNLFKISHSFHGILEYALFPAGKLFRSKLIYALASDLNSHSPDHEYFASAVEMHHTYTLIHDDLPAMDDDDYRRGRLSTHKKFGQANAILAGDALLGMSYGLLSNIKGPILSELLELFHLKTGQQGLILGQVLDLEGSTKSLEDIITIHKLKTARLIQLSLSGANLLSKKSAHKEQLEAFGESLGITFQLLDDLCELAAPLSPHESEINPFVLFGQEVVFDKLKENMKVIQLYLKNNKLQNLESVIEKYYEKIKSLLVDGQNSILKSIKLEHLNEILSLTSF